MKGKNSPSVITALVVLLGLFVISVLAYVRRPSQAQRAAVQQRAEFVKRAEDGGLLADINCPAGKVQVTREGWSGLSADEKARFSGILASYCRDLGAAPVLDIIEYPTGVALAHFGQSGFSVK